MINQAKLKSYRRDPFWKFGVLVPRNHAQEVELDKENRMTHCNKVLVLGYCSEYLRVIP
jgi:hypothetical protein